MGNHDVGRALSGAAEVFWSMVPPGTRPGREATLRALELAARHWRGADAEFDDHLSDAATPLGRMVAIAFEATPAELDPADPDVWYDGPYSRFRAHFGFG